MGVGLKGEGEHPLVPGPVLHSNTAVDRGRYSFFRVRGRVSVSVILGLGTGVLAPPASTVKR